MAYKEQFVTPISSKYNGIYRCSLRCSGGQKVIRRYFTLVVGASDVSQMV